MRKKQLQQEETEIGNFNYCQSRKARDELKEIIEILKAVSDITLMANRFNTSIKMNGRVIGTLWPLKNTWSGSAGQEKIQRWDSPTRYLNAIKLEIETVRKEKVNLKPSKGKVPTLSDADVIQVLEQRILKMSPTSKGINLKGFKMTKPLCYVAVSIKRYFVRRLQYIFGIILQFKSTGEDHYFYG